MPWCDEDAAGLTFDILFMQPAFEPSGSIAAAVNCAVCRRGCLLSACLVLYSITQDVVIGLPR